MFRRQYILKAALTCAFIAFLTPTAHADFASSQRWFNSMDEEDRSLLQSDLMLLGHYNALADSTFGNFTYRAIQAFQSSIGQSPTGVLTQRQEDLLRDSSTALYHELGFDIVEDARGRMAMLLPQKLLPSVSETRRGTAYTSADGSIRLETIRKPFADESYESLYRSLAATSATRKVSYKVLNSDKFVVSGTREDKLFYILINNTPGESAGFSVEWERSNNQVGAMVATFMASYSYPLAFAQPDSSATVATHQPEVTPQPAPQASPPATPPAPQSSSGTGFFVAEKGVLVTNHHVIDGCSAIDVVGYGPARLITSDEDVDLAVLQLRTAKAHPVAEIRAEAAQLGESVVALGFPLADILNSSLNMGTGIVSSETGFFGDETRFTTNVGIQPGNSGGPILDEYGRVLGVAVSKINDEALLAAMGTTAPNVGFAIKGEVVADYLSLFRLPEPSAEPEKPLSARELAELGRNFTVQITCDIAQSATSAPPAQSPVATNSFSPALPSGYRWVVLVSSSSIAGLPNLSRAVYPATTRIVLSESGSFGLVVGPFTEGFAETLLDDWKRNSTVPGDAYLSSGNRFIAFADGL
ncbi:serine protease [Devosia sp. YIM 151766]|uniref:serine protease n=1 Tax=Devosia sp. YIM 151766 TaxID=3017325 RepID=UPI00255D070A|nr:serine protease [Devosia sp. YIM 151766]WIY51462.1 serine protease [Devosia sp. YIM 151766]